MKMLANSINLKGMAFSFVLGGLLSAGAAVLMTTKLKGKNSALKSQKKEAREGSDMYCQVPEGADICFPE
jgi:hypothetical protein